MTGTAETRLVVLRGNSAAGKSTIGGILRDEIGPGLAIIEQDHVRRIVLREDDRPDSANIGLLSSMARFCLDAGFDVLVEGILDSERYGAMLLQLTRDHVGVSGLVCGIAPAQMHFFQRTPGVALHPAARVRSPQADPRPAQRDLFVRGRGVGFLSASQRSAEGDE